MTDSNDGRIDPPLEVNLGNNPGSVVFHTFQEVIDWAGVESKAWGALAASGASKPVSQQLVVQRNTPNDLINRATERDLQHVREILLRYPSYQCLHSTSIWGRRVLALAERSTLEAAYLAWAKAEWEKESTTGKGSGWLANAQTLPHSSFHIGAIARVAALAASDELAAQQATVDAIERRLVAAESTWRTTINEARDRERAALEAFATATADHLVAITTQLDTKDRELTDFVAKRQTELADFLTDGLTRVDEFIAKRKTEIEELERVFREKISLEAPVTYWRKKEAAHSRAVVIWGVGTVAVTLAPLVLLGYHRSDALQWFKDVQSNLSTGGTAILLVVAVLYLAFGRFVAKLFSSSFALRNDAAERVVMAETFLALHRDGKLSDEDRRMVLAPLFRSHGAPAETETAAGIADSFAKALSK